MWTPGIAQHAYCTSISDHKKKLPDILLFFAGRFCVFSLCFRYEAKLERLLVCIRARKCARLHACVPSCNQSWCFQGQIVLAVFPPSSPWTLNTINEFYFSAPLTSALLSAVMWITNNMSEAVAQQEPSSMELPLCLKTKEAPKDKQWAVLLLKTPGSCMSQPHFN